MGKIVNSFDKAGQKPFIFNYCAGNQGILNAHGKKYHEPMGA